MKMSAHIYSTAALSLLLLSACSKEAPKHTSAQVSEMVLKAKCEKGFNQAEANQQLLESLKSSSTPEEFAVRTYFISRPVNKKDAVIPLNDEMPIFSQESPEQHQKPESNEIVITKNCATLKAEVKGPGFIFSDLDIKSYETNSVEHKAEFSGIQKELVVTISYSRKARTTPHANQLDSEIKNEDIKKGQGARKKQLKEIRKSQLALGNVVTELKINIQNGAQSESYVIEQRTGDANRADKVKFDSEVSAFLLDKTAKAGVPAVLQPLVAQKLGVDSSAMPIDPVTGGAAPLQKISSSEGIALSEDEIFGSVLEAILESDEMSAAEKQAGEAKPAAPEVKPVVDASKADSKKSEQAQGAAKPTPNENTVGAPAVEI